MCVNGLWSTDADKIIVLSNPHRRGSRVVEMGKHRQLMKIPNGVYKHLVNISHYTEER